MGWNMQSNQNLQTLSKQELLDLAHQLQKRVAEYEDTFLTMEEVAERYKKSKACICKWRAAGLLKGLKVIPGKQGAVMFPLSEIVAFESKLRSQTGIA